LDDTDPVVMNIPDRLQMMDNLISDGVKDYSLTLAPQKCSDVRIFIHVGAPARIISPSSPLLSLTPLSVLSALQDHPAA